MCVYVWMCVIRPTTSNNNKTHQQEPDERNAERRGEEKIRIEWTKKSYWTLNCFPTINVRSCKKCIRSLSTHTHMVCVVASLLAQKNLSIKIEEEKNAKCFSEGSAQENGRVERWENEKSFNFQSIIKVVIKRELISHIIRAARSVSERERKKQKLLFLLLIYVETDEMSVLTQFHMQFSSI